LFLSCFCKTKQGVIEIKEWHPPSTIRHRHIERDAVLR
jgi:hypothetical protein